jgi:hypothetical protein
MIDPGGRDLSATPAVHAHARVSDGRGTSMPPWPPWPGQVQFRLVRPINEAIFPARNLPCPP